MTGLKVGHVTYYLEVNCMKITKHYGLSKKRHMSDSLATKINFSNFFTNDVIVTGSHRNPKTHQETCSMNHPKVIWVKK